MGTKTPRLQSLFRDVRSCVPSDVMALNVMHVVLGLRKMAWLPRIHRKLDGVLTHEILRDGDMSVLHVDTNHLRFTSVARMPAHRHQALLHAYANSRAKSAKIDPRVETRVGTALGYLHPGDIAHVSCEDWAALSLSYILRKNADLEGDPIFVQTVVVTDPDLLTRVTALRRRYQKRLRKIFPDISVSAHLSFDDPGERTA